MANFQNITGVKLGQVAMTTSYQTVYTTPLLTRTFLKDIIVCNTTVSGITFTAHLVPSAGTATAANALFYTTALAASSTFQWSGTQIMDAGDTLQALASATGVTLTASGGEAT